MTHQRCRRALQLTLAVIKPDAVAHPIISEAVHDKILDNQFMIIRSKILHWTRGDSQNFYKEHSGRFFYRRLVEFMSSGPIKAYILAHEDAIRLWRDLMGPTKVFRARYTVPDSIRGTYGLTDTRNTTHGSDSPESASREMAFFFPEFNESCWYEQEEPYFRSGPVLYDQKRLIHMLCQEKDLYPPHGCMKEQPEPEMGS
ncbi:nucleoside diphosphate kinase 6 [Ambystoma mexicanum]|uniref:nucleoside diphosphate kinase 6 n=1 Tax=Ambystoma mexicanum TaxID=8296 RepID=UPI0037E8CC3E